MKLIEFFFCLSLHKILWIIWIIVCRVGLDIILNSHKVILYRNFAWTFSLFSRILLCKICLLIFLLHSIVINLMCESVSRKAHIYTWNMEVLFYFPFTLLVLLLILFFIPFGRIVIFLWFKSYMPCAIQHWTNNAQFTFTNHSKESMVQV